MVSTLTLGPYSMGVVAGLGTALLWALTSLCFEGAGRRLGSLLLNLVRLVLASGFFLLLSLVTTGQAFTTQAGPAAWGWLLLSGLVGFVLGDLFLFQAFVLIGARRSMLVYCSVPPLTALIGWVSLGEKMRPTGLVGMGLTLAGIALAIGLPQGRKLTETAPALAPPRLLEGVMLAFGGSLGQAVGMVLGKYGAEAVAGAPLGSFAATQVRALAGMAGFALLVGVTGRYRELGQSLREALRPAPGSLPKATTGDSPEPSEIRVGYLLAGIGAFAGPFLGVSLGLWSAQLTTTGVASTLMSTVPIVLIPLSMLLFKERPRRAEVAGALLAVAGVAFMAW